MKDNDCKMRYHTSDEPDAWVIVKPGDPMWSLVCAQDGVQYWSVSTQRWVDLLEGQFDNESPLGYDPEEE